MCTCVYTHVCIRLCVYRGTRYGTFVGVMELFMGVFLFICYVGLSDWIQLFRISSRYFYPLINHTVSSICSKEDSKLQNFISVFSNRVIILPSFVLVSILPPQITEVINHVLFFSWPLDEYLLWITHSVFTTAFPIVTFTLTNRWKQYLGA